jgi:ABC-type antimicrobial peptide transport system permease subunit
VTREAAFLTGAGVITGILGALASTRLLSGLLYGVGTMEPIVLLGVSGLTAIAGAAASIVPARRALRADPCEALRSP